MQLLSLLFSLASAAILLPTTLASPIHQQADVISHRENHVVRRTAPVRKAISLENRIDTNAKRFARGLPPLSPSTSRRSSGTPVRRTGSSPIPAVTYHGVIQVLKSSDNSVLGYISTSSTGYNNDFMYRNARDSNTLTVYFTLPGGQSSGTQLNIGADNSKLNTNGGGIYEPYLGFGIGFRQSLARGSSNSSPLVGVSAIPSGGKPSSGQVTDQDYPFIESAIWNIDSVSGLILPQWINTDGSTPSLDLFTKSGGGTFIWLGDAPQNAGSTKIYLKFVV